MHAKSNGFKIALVFVMLAALAVATGTATYAWFSSNSVVETDMASGRSGTDEVKLLVSSSGGGSFRGAEEASIEQVNKTKTDNLMPVSTADLSHFVYNTGTVQGEAVHFEKVKDEQYYYNGRIYLQAVAEDRDKSERMALYLDNASENGGEFLQNTKGSIANAARLGLTFDDDNKVILRLSEENNAKSEQAGDTVIDGTRLSTGQVIDSSGSSLKAVKDPSVALKEYLAGDNGLGEGATEPLLLMELNRIYTVDIYFYLEGCDPDCSDVTQLGKTDFHLAFYGVLTEGGR